jgi:hypothetical protein
MSTDTKGASKSRGLSDDFLMDLKKGILFPILEAVKADNNLILEIREDTINIYYRGGNLLLVKRDPKTKKYLTGFDKNYIDKSRINKFSKYFKQTISSKEEAAWLTSNFIMIKNEMDMYLAKKNKLEKEFQQLVVRENNILGEANNTDYYIIDFEYQSRTKIQNKNPRFDLIALRWDSDRNERKKRKNCRIALIEMKYGDGAIKNKTSGLKEHVNDVELFLSDNNRVLEFKKEMVNIFQQKRELGLIKFGKGGNAHEISIDQLREEIEFILLLAGNKHEKSQLKTEINSLTEMKNAELKFSTASFMGYGLYSKSMLTLIEFKEKYKERLQLP